MKPTQGFSGFFFVYHSYRDAKMTLKLGFLSSLNIHNAAFET